MRRREYKITNLDGTESITLNRNGYVLSSMDLGYIDVNTSSYTGSGQMGRTVTSRNYTTRDVYMTGHIVADSETEMRNLKVAFQRIVAPIQDFWLVVDGKYKLRLMADTTLQYDSHAYRNNDLLCSFALSCTASNPFFQTVEDSVGKLSGWVKDFHFPYCNPVGQRFIFGHKNETKVYDINNESEVACGMVITLKAIGGTVVNPQVLNVDTMEALKVNGTLNASETLVIDTTYGQKSIRNVTTGANWLHMFDLESTWLQIGPGVTSFKCDCDESSTGTIEAQVAFTPYLLGV